MKKFLVNSIANGIGYAICSAILGAIIITPMMIAELICKLLGVG